MAGAFWPIAQFLALERRISSAKIKANKRMQPWSVRYVITDREAENVMKKRARTGLALFLALSLAVCLLSVIPAAASGDGVTVMRNGIDYHCTSAAGGRYTFDKKTLDMTQDSTDALYLTIDNADALGGGWMMVNLSPDPSGLSDAVMPRSAMIRVETDNKDGTGVIAVSFYEDREFWEMKGTLNYTFGEQIQIRTEYNPVDRWHRYQLTFGEGKVVNYTLIQIDDGGDKAKNTFVPTISFEKDAKVTVSFEQHKAPSGVTTAADGSGLRLTSADGGWITLDQALDFSNGTADALYLTIPSADALGNSWMMVNFSLDPSGLNGAAMAYSAMIRVEKDNGDGTGVLRLTSFEDNEMAFGDLIRTLDYTFGEPIRIRTEYNNIDHWHRYQFMTGAADSTAVFYNFTQSDDGNSAEKNTFRATVSFDKASEVKVGFTDERSGWHIRSMGSSQGFAAGKTPDTCDVTVHSAGWLQLNRRVDLTKGVKMNIEFGGDWCSVMFGDKDDLGCYNITNDRGVGVTYLLRNILVDENDPLSAKLGVSDFSFGIDRSETTSLPAGGKDNGKEYTLRFVKDPIGTEWMLTINGVETAVSVSGEDFDRLNGFDTQSGTYAGTYMGFGCFGGSSYITNIALCDDSDPQPEAAWRTGSGMTVEKKTDVRGDYYDLTGPNGAWTRSLQQIDLTRGFSFNIEEMKGWLCLGLSAEKSGLKKTAATSVEDGCYGWSMLLKNDNGRLYMSLFDGNGESLMDTYNISPIGSHTLRFVETDGRYRLYLDSTLVLGALALPKEEFDRLNNVGEDGTAAGAYVQLGTEQGMTVTHFRAYQPVSEDYIKDNSPDWTTDSYTKIRDNGDGTYDLDMKGIASARLKKTLDLAAGIPLKLDGLTFGGGRFGLGFGAKQSTLSLDVPPAAQEDYYQLVYLSMNEDGTVQITLNSGETTALALDMTKAHTFGMTRKGAAYVLTVDGEAVFDTGLDVLKYSLVNNGSMGTYLTVFTENDIAVTGLTGKFYVAPSGDTDPDDPKLTPDDPTDPDDDHNDRDDDPKTGVALPIAAAAVLAVACTAVVLTRRRVR